VHAPPPAGIGAPVDWSALPGWDEDDLNGAWTALKRSCEVLRARDADWANVCSDADLLGEPDTRVVRAFMQTRFVPHVVQDGTGNTEGLVTGYYEPLLFGSTTRTTRFHYPLYRRPDDLLVIDLGGLYPELRGKRVRGRLVGNRVVPYFSRAEIDNRRRPLAGHEIVWVDDPVALFFLQVQGSGRIRLTNGEMLYVGYADQNGHPYVAIGRELINRGVMTFEDMSMQRIRDWLRANPDQADDILARNPSYVFFTERSAELDGPLGSLGVPLVAQRAVAVDPAYISLGLPLWLDTTFPGNGNGNGNATPYRRLVFAQDTGGAIKGPVRADLFWGAGPSAEKLAGEMKQPGRLFVLLPRSRQFAAASPPS